WSGPDTLTPLITTLNRLRRRHPALQQLRNITFLETDNDRILAYRKRFGDDLVIVVVNLDPHQVQQATVTLDAETLAAGRPLTVHDELTGATYTWGQENYVRLDPSVSPAHIVTVDQDR
ncbi:alpha-glucosidase C-terminal domain-containing protein, partial [Kitasatospora cystarginea]|uniref:alpha-glucosidase C-terminal domain-containing protein n=2 Tax=Kitasatospora TaxID=2063 RepID=UPI0031E1F791